MPSLRSNKNKLGIPSQLDPIGTVCIPVNVPNDPEWISLFTGAIYRLSQQIWYDRDEAHSAKYVAAKWRDIYLETLNRSWICGDASLFDMRVNPTDSCSIQKTMDGVLWFEVFRLDGPCGTSRLRVNPYTGRIGRVMDDFTFYEFPDGEWGASLYPPFSSLPPPIVTADRVCVAAVTAVYVLSNLYRDIGVKLLDEVAATDWDYAAALGTILQGFLLVIGAAAVQPYVAFATLLGIVGVRQQYVDYPLVAQDIEDLTCLFYENATEIGDSVVFDFQAIWDGVALASPKNGLFRFMMTMVGPDAVNYAGAIDAGLSADCDNCVEPHECLSFNEHFTSGMREGMFIADNSWPVLNAVHDSRNNGQWSSTGGRTTLGCLTYTDDPDSALRYRGDFVIDLGGECTVLNFYFWRGFAGSGSTTIYVRYYDENKVEKYSGGQQNTGGYWSQLNYPADVADVRYIRVSISSYWTWHIDDFEVIVDV
jgi:hypothetical protein